MFAAVPFLADFQFTVSRTFLQKILHNFLIYPYFDLHKVGGKNLNLIPSNYKNQKFYFNIKKCLSLLKNIIKENVTVFGRTRFLEQENRTRCAFG
jgi:hypothetical protein